jgi:hypothetical protein
MGNKKSRVYEAGVFGLEADGELVRKVLVCFSSATSRLY